MNGIFITGTNTGVGKTWIGSQLVAHLHNIGINVIPQKPIESGCTLVDGKLLAQDAKQYFDACKGSIKSSQITPFRYTQICSPARASVLTGDKIKLKNIIKHIDNTTNKKSFVVLEGAGGIYSPLTVDALNIDLAKAVALPIILIAEDCLGCINSILLSLKAIEDAGLVCIAVVLNSLSDNVNVDTDNLQELQQYTQVPIIKNALDNNDAVIKIASLLIF